MFELDEIQEDNFLDGEVEVTIIGTDIQDEKCVISINFCQSALLEDYVYITFPYISKITRFLFLISMGDKRFDVIIKKKRRNIVNIFKLGSFLTFKFEGYVVNYSITNNVESKLLENESPSIKTKTIKDVTIEFAISWIEVNQ